ncbi:endogenous retrovirus group K member 9 Gag polyprotein-like [Natator depressus]|uniref:endogenous retrovirus group K member 9 Gag polyprotein-like n=1 Tax=Natator depressus TaxID=27790 RepID=UPI003EB82E16
MVHAAKTRSDLAAEELADLVSVCPVTWQDDGQGNQVADWVSLPYSVIREVKKAIREFGLTSTYVRGLIEGIGTGYTLIPEDWKALLRMMLTPSQYVIWLSEYRQMAERQAQVYREQGVIYEHLAGEGQFATVQLQSQLPQAVFPIISACAQHAFRKVPDSGRPTKSFASIRQGASESFMDFTNRLQEAILRQVDNPAAAQEILLKMAVENANEDCCRALQAAQASGILELSDMLRVCQNIGTQAHKAGVLAAALRKTGKEGKRCYRCVIPLCLGYSLKAMRAPIARYVVRTVVGSGLVCATGTETAWRGTRAVEPHTGFSADLGGDRGASRVDNGGTETEEA